MYNNNTRLFSIISYITWIGWIVALAMHDRNDRMVRHHLNQALVLNILATIVNAAARMGNAFASICGIIDLGLFVLWIMAIYRAYKLSDEPLPIIGNIRLFS